MQAKQLSPNSWLMISDNTKKRVGIVSRKNEQSNAGGKKTDIFRIMGNDKQFFSLEDVAGHFDENLKAYEEEERTTVFEIHGYPVKHVFIDNIETCDKTEIVSYTKGATGNVRYGAGYYCIHFNTDWHLIHCPKIDTLNDYEYVGPFKDKMNARFELKGCKEREQEAKD